MHRLSYWVICLILPMMLVGLLSELDVRADDFMVTTADDFGPGSLRQIIQNANENPGADTITFNLAPESIITLTYGTPADTILITDTLTIDGRTAVSLTISGNNERNIFTVGPGTAVTITHLTLANGYGLAGAAIYNDGDYLKIAQCQFLHNDSASYPGAAIYNQDGTVVIWDSTFRYNQAALGGAIHQLSGTTTISNTIFENNMVAQSGGAISIAGGDATVEHSRIISNSAFSGGGVFNDGMLTLVDTGIFSNTAAHQGGGIYSDNHGQLFITNGFIAFNQAGYGGGGLDNHGVSTVTTSQFHQNDVVGPDHGFGGAVENFGPLTVYDTVFTKNHAPYGGGIYNYSATAVIQTCQFDENTALSGGGIESDYGFLYVNNSTLVNNLANQGGAVFNFGNLSLTNNTLSGNVASGVGDEEGGGAIMQAYGVLTLTHNTIANNTAPNWPGRDGIWQTDGRTSIQHSIVAENGVGNCGLAGGVWDGASYNLADDGSCPGFTLADPILAPLGNYGGDTLTHALLPGSPAVDAGDNDLCASTDQRGEPRPVDGNVDGMAVCDIGSVEMDYHPALTLTVSPAFQTIVAGETAVFTLTIRNTGSITLAQIQVESPFLMDCTFAQEMLLPGEEENQVCSIVSVAESFTMPITITAQMAGFPSSRIHIDETMQVLVEWRQFLPVVLKS